MVKIYTLYFKRKRLENHSLWRCTYLSSVYEGVTARGFLPATQKAGLCY